ncbi:MAG: radical SAM/SPASM domain-containing protein [Bacteroidales bacterium]
MFFKQKSTVIFRKFESFGYITDNRNFGYKLIGQNENIIGDKILSESGAVFMSVLNKKPQSIERLVEKIMMHFTDVECETLKNDAIEFFFILERDGFVVSGETIKACNDKDPKFSYKSVDSKLADSVFPLTKMHPENTTQDFFDDYFQGKPQLTNLHIEIISKCNERCLHCYIPHESKEGQIDPDLFFSILKQCIDMRMVHLTISGGEPMLHKNFCDFLRRIKKHNFSVNILSNLTLLNGDFIKEMKANPLLGVQVSLYSMDPSIHDEITQKKGSFEMTRNGILELVKNNIPLQISCPILKQNRNNYSEVIQWAKSLKIQVGDDYGIIARYDHTKQNLSCRLTIHEVKEVIKDKIANNSEFINQIVLAAEKKKNISPSDFVCSVCNSSICISESGDVYPCAGWQDYVVGNIKDNSLKDIWENSKKVQYLRNLRNQDFPKCIECLDKDYCSMCLVRNANEDSKGDLLVVNEYFCKIANLNRAFARKCMDK